MQNFSFKNPTEILFGKGMIAEIGSRVPGKVPVLLLYGVEVTATYAQLRREYDEQHV